MRRPDTSPHAPEAAWRPGRFGSRRSAFAPNSALLLAAVWGCLRAGHAPVVLSSGLTPRERTEMVADIDPVAVLGADAHGKAEVALDALARCRVFCDEWEQASKGGELSGAVTAGVIGRQEVTEIGAVLAGRAPGRRGDGEVTLFDSTGLAIQDLGIARAVLDAMSLPIGCRAPTEVMASVVRSKEPSTRM